MSHDHFHSSPQLLLNDIAWDQAPQWGKKEKKEGQIGKILHCYL